MMNKKKQTDKASTKGFNRDSELRIRNVAPEIKKELHEIMKLNPKKFPFESYAIEHLILNYRQDQTAIKQLHARISQLNLRLQKLETREKTVAVFVKSFQNYLKDGDKHFKALFASAIRSTVNLSNQFSGTLKNRQPAAGGQGKRKTVPQKKGGRK